MKSFTKISLMLAAITCGIGVLAVVIGLVMGARLKDLEQMGIYISPNQVEVSRVIRNEIRDEFLDEFDDNHHRYGNHGFAHESSITEGKYSSEGISRLEVEVQNADITFFTVEDTKEISYSSNRGKAIAKVRDNTLTIEEDISLKDHLELEIYLPVGVMREIEIEVANGVVTADNIVADHVNLDMGNASVNIQQLTVNNKAELQINAGEMNIGYYEGPNLDLECAVGAMKVVCEGTKNDYNYHLECGVGEIVLDNETYSGLGQKTQVKNGGSKLIEAECGMGQIQIEFPNNL